MKLQENILNSKQKGVLSRLDFLAGTSLYMGGGTALALQLGHRTSEDFDLYSPEKFDVSSLRNLFLERIPETKVLSEHADGALQMKMDGIDVSVFYSPYKLIGDLVEFHSIKLASIEDIAAAKVAAVVQRARQRDFIDIYYLTLEMGFNEVLECAYRKFPWYGENNVIVLKSLTYFSEADLDSQAARVRVLDTKVTWEVVKVYIKNQMDKYLMKI